MEGMGEETLFFFLLKSGKRQKVHLGRSVSIHFVADCSYEKEDPFLSGIDFIELMSVKGYFRELERAACVKKNMSANDLFEFNILG